MTIFITIIHVIVCFVLILVILLQAGRGQGLGSASFGSGNVQSLLGTRAADFLTKATTVSALCFLFTCIGLDFIEARKSKSLLELENRAAPVNIEQIKEALEKVKSEMEAKTPVSADAVSEGVETKPEAISQEMVLEGTAATLVMDNQSLPAQPIAEAEPVSAAASDEKAQTTAASDVTEVPSEVPAASETP